LGGERRHHQHPRPDEGADIKGGASHRAQANLLVPHQLEDIADRGPSLASITEPLNRND
jgi:hypothetical protein